MITENRRVEPRHRCDQVKLKLDLNGEVYEGVMFDVSRGAARLNDSPLGDNHVGHKGTILVTPNLHKPFRKDCRVADIGDERPGISVVEFCGGLTSPQLDAAAQGDGTDESHMLETARRDDQAVREELLSIQNCRSQIFVGTIAALGAAAMTTGIAISKAPKAQWPVWVVFGAGIGAFLLLVGILATIEKARAINLRKGFLRALADYLRKAQAPPSYAGWGHLRSLQNICGFRRETGECTQVRRYEKEGDEYEKAVKAHAENREKEPDPGDPPVLSETCWTLGNFEMSQASSVESLIPGMFDSFMSFTGMVYCLSYAMVAATILISLTVLFAHRGLPGLISVVCIIVGIVLGTLVVYFSPRVFKRDEVPLGAKLDTTEPTRKLMRVIIYSCGVVAVVLVGICVSPLGDSWIEFALSGLSLVLFSASVAGLAVYLVHQLSKVRRGLYSPAALYASWRHAFLDCQHDDPIRDRFYLQLKYRALKRPSRLF